MAHIPDLHSVLRGVKNLLKYDGVLIFEDPYLGDILDKTSYDQIYDEHAFYFSITSLSYLLNQHDMEIIDVHPQKTHGGSMRYTVAHSGMYKINKFVNFMLVKEKINNFHKQETYENFKDNVEKSRNKLVNLILKIKSKGHQVVGYAATAKSATITNYCGIRHNLIDYICDTTPIKQGKFSPGSHIPIKPYQEWLDNPPSHTLLFAWNHSKEIMEKEAGYTGKWISYVPKVAIL